MVEFSLGFVKKLREIDKRYLQAVIDAIKKFPAGDIKKLKGYPNGFLRIRVGKYRAIIFVDYERKTIKAIDIDSRGDIYK